ncbi:MAG: pYEATS domain-containing protein [bacterium]
MVVADWIPLLQTLVWPVTVLALVLILRKPTRSLYTTVLERVRYGASLTLGKDGVSLTGGEKIPLPDEKRASIKEAISGSVASFANAPTAEPPAALSGAPKKGPGIFVGQVSPGMASEMEMPGMATTQIERQDIVGQSLYLVHAVGAATKDRDGQQRRDITVALDADVDELLSRVDRVVYHLHPTFPDPDREVRDRRTNFQLKTRAWGQFNLTADVYVKGLDEPVHLMRYLNFPAAA